MGISESRPATSPISGRLPASRSPPQPKTTSTRRSASSAHRLQGRLQRLRRVAVVDVDRERLTGLHRLHAAGQRVDVGDAGADRLGVEPERLAAGDRRQHVEQVEAAEQRRGDGQLAARRGER